MNGIQPNTPTNRPGENPPPSTASDREAQRGDKQLTDLENIKFGKDQVKKRTHDSLKELKKGVYSISLDARSGVDRAPYKHSKWLQKAEGKLKEIERTALVEIENLIPQKPLNPEEYKKLIEQIKAIVIKHEKAATYYWHALVYSVKAFAGVNGAIKVEDYALFDSLLENINNLYAKDIKIAEVISHIQQRTLDDKDWTVICAYIEKYPYKKNVDKAQDRINMSITAFFVQMMDANQRYELVLKFHEKNNRDVDKTSDLIKTFAETNVINIAQMRSLMKQIKGGEYEMSLDEEKLILARQEETMRLTREVRRTMRSPLVINSAERILNPKSLAACAAIAIGSLGMVMNVLSRFNKGKGLGRLGGFSSPWFIFSAAVTAGGVHALGSGMRPGETPGFLDKMYPTPKRMENPFGVAKNAEAQDASFTELVNLCTTYKTVEKYLFETDGFADVMAFYADKKADVVRMEEESKIREVTKPKGGPKTDVFEEFMQYVEKNRKNPKGKGLLEKIDKAYGRQTARWILFRLFVSVHKVGVMSARSFEKDKIPHQQFTYYQLYKHRAGLEPLKMPVATPTGQAAGQPSSQSSTSHR